MPERLEGEERAFNEWIVSGQVNVIPDKRSLNRGQSDDKANGSEKEITRPLFAAEGDYARAKVTATRRARRLVHGQGCEREAASLKRRASSRLHERTLEVSELL